MESMPADSYEYASLGDGYFRTLLLHPGSGDDPLHCSLQTSLLSDASFEAISYAWGDVTQNHEITCDGQIIHITANLRAALEHLRRPTPRLLWADSICIDQQNNEEKAQQVGIMGQIFRFAQRVLIFLGAEDFEHGESVRSLLDETATMIRKELQLCGTARDSFPWPANDAPILQDTRWASLEQMFKQSWFRRGWVIQEAALAKEGRLIWGKHEFNWNDLTLVATWADMRTTLTSEVRWRTMDTHLLLCWTFEKNIIEIMGSDNLRFGFLDLLDAAKSAQFSDARDRIYAFEEVARDLECYVSVPPNYNAPLLHTYQVLAVEFIYRRRDVKLLNYVQHTEDSFQRTVPSWVPRWDIDMATSIALPATRSAPLKTRNLSLPEPRIIGDSTLRVRSVVLDEVAYASEIHHVLDEDKLETVENLWRHVCLISTTSVYPKANLIDAFLDTMTNCGFVGEWSKWRRNEAAYALQLLDSINNLDEDELAQWRLEARGGDLVEVNKHMHHVSHKKMFILTRRGYMGLAPRITREGDTCAIIFGCTTPCILRKMDQTSQYGFVGGAVILSKEPSEVTGKKICFGVLGADDRQDWVDWDVDEQDIDLF